MGGAVLDEQAGVDAGQFRSALRRHANGVVVVTAAADGQIAGLTVTSLVALSLDPPLVCFGVATRASAYPVLAACRTFEVNFLGAGQEPIAKRFATRGVDRFAPPTRWSRRTTGEPILLDAPAHLRCEVEQRVPAGDHVLVIGRVLDSGQRRSHSPLIYHEGRYGSLRPPGWWRRWRRPWRRHWRR